MAVLARVRSIVHNNRSRGRAGATRCPVQSRTSVLTRDWEPHDSRRSQNAASPRRRHNVDSRGGWRLTHARSRHPIDAAADHEYHMPQGGCSPTGSGLREYDHERLYDDNNVGADNDNYRITYNDDHPTYNRRRTPDDGRLQLDQLGIVVTSQPRWLADLCLETLHR